MRAWAYWDRRRAVRGVLLVDPDGRAPVLTEGLLTDGRLVPPGGRPIHGRDVEPEGLLIAVRGAEPDGRLIDRRDVRPEGLVIEVRGVADGRLTEGRDDDPDRLPTEDRDAPPDGLRISDRRVLLDGRVGVGLEPTLDGLRTTERRWLLEGRDVALELGVPDGRRTADLRVELGGRLAAASEDRRGARDGSTRERAPSARALRETARRPLPTPVERPPCAGDVATPDGAEAELVGRRATVVPVRDRGTARRWVVPVTRAAADPVPDGVTVVAPVLGRAVRARLRVESAFRSTVVSPPVGVDAPTAPVLGTARRRPGTRREGSRARIGPLRSAFESVATEARSARLTAIPAALPRPNSSDGTTVHAFARPEV